MATAGDQPGVDIIKEVTEAIQNFQWTTVLRLVQASDCSEEQHHWAIVQCVKCAPESTVNKIIDVSSDDHLDSVLSHLCTRRLWRCVGRVLQRAISSTQHRWAVVEASKHAGDHAFVQNILPQCHEEELEHVVTHLLSRKQWESVGQVLQLGTNITQHRWAVEEASKHADEDDFADHILHHCTYEELEQVLTHMVSRGLWKPVNRATQSNISVTQHILSQIVSQGVWKAVGRILLRDISSTQHRWAVEEASKHANCSAFVEYILPQCDEEDLKRIMTHFVSWGRWRSVGQVLEQCVNTKQHRWAVEEASKRGDEQSFAEYILHHCTDQELEHVLTHMVSRGLWEPVNSVPLSNISVTQHILSQIVSRGLWKAVGRFLLRDISSTQHRWAVEEASKHANCSAFVEYILPQCDEEDLERIMTHFVSWGRWRSVGQVLERSVNTKQHRWAVEEASKRANEQSFADHILHHCTLEELEHVLTHMVSRGLWKPANSVTQSNISVTQRILTQIVSKGMWKAVGRFLLRYISRTQHRWAVEEASKHASCSAFVAHILPQCHEEELEHVVTHLVSWRQWESVDRVLKQNINITQHRWAVEEASKHADDKVFLHGILHHCSDDDIVAVFPLLVRNKKWTCTWRVLHDIVCDTLRTWVTSGHDSTAHETLFWKLMHSCHIKMSLALDLKKAVTRDTTYISMDGRVSWKKQLREILAISMLHTVCSVVCSGDREYTDSTEQTKQCVSDIYTHITACVRDNTDCVQHNTLRVIQNKEKWTSVFTHIANTHTTDPLFLLHFLQGINLYHHSRRGQKDDAILGVMFTVLPLFPQLQGVAFGIMILDKRWDVISQACLSHVWEHDRRRLFTAAVEQGQWSVVERWSDHTVHDDQREWAMKEAFRDGQWEVYLLLADHGLTMPEQMHAHYMVAKYGDWDTVLQMAERGGDMTEVSVLLENYVTKQLRRKPQADVTRYIKRCKNLIRLRVYMATDSALSPMKVLKRGKWRSVLFHILHKPTEDYFSRVVDTAIKKRAWPVLMHLVRLGMKAAERDWLFPEMVRQQQWGVCRMLLEYGVDAQLCLEALPELMEKNQWTLVARVMEYEVDDALRRQVMQCAFQKREGALFWHCLTTMKDKEDMSVETREKLFHQAISRDIWQAVKPLVEENDSLGIQHRDIAFLEAIEQHLWDVVDHCQLYSADINMKDENGETPLHREARKGEWKAVEEIVSRDGDPNLLDKDGVCVLNRLICNRQWEIVRTVIKYGGNIHLPARYHECRNKRHTPLQALIDVRQVDIIQFALIWCPDQWKGVNSKGETTLHAACDSDRWDVMWDLVARKVNPLAVTKTGQTALVYAVLNRKCPQRMVAECSKLGFGTHQPSVTGLPKTWLDDVIRVVLRSWKDDWYCNPTYLRYSAITSPLLCAVLRDLPVVTLMLYESGACSDTELVTLYTQLPRITDRDRTEGRKLYEHVCRLVERAHRHEDAVWLSWQREGPVRYLQYYSTLTQTIEKNAAFLRQLATTPRTLLSSCRRLISQRLGGCDKNRYKRVDQFPLPVPLKNYILFSDLRDPDYGKLLGLPSDDT